MCIRDSGTVYYSDTYGLEDRLKVLQVVPYDLTGNVIYPTAQVVNKEADETEQAAAKDFVEFLTSDEAAAIFRNCLLYTSSFSEAECGASKRTACAGTD